MTASAVCRWAAVPLPCSTFSLVFSGFREVEGEGEGEMEVTDEMPIDGLMFKQVNKELTPKNRAREKEKYFFHNMKRKTKMMTNITRLFKST